MKAGGGSAGYMELAWSPALLEAKDIIKPTHRVFYFPTSNIQERRRKCYKIVNMIIKALTLPDSQKQ